MGSQGSLRGNFQRAIDRRQLAYAEALARQLEPLSVADALAFLLLLGEHEPFTKTALKSRPTSVRGHLVSTLHSRLESRHAVRGIRVSRRNSAPKGFARRRSRTLSMIRKCNALYAGRPLASSATRSGGRIQLAHTELIISDTYS